MASLLVSFCNVFPRGLAIGLYDFEDSAFQWLDLSLAGPDIRGVTGLCRHRDRYWCLAQLDRPGYSALIALDDRLGAAEVYELELAREAHSLMTFEDGLLLADTGANRLVWVKTPPGGGSCHEVEYWRYCDEPSDIVHLNSVASLDGKLYVSIFGPRPDEGWSLGLDGKIINATDNVVVRDHIAQPHSLLAHDGELYWVESQTGWVQHLTHHGALELVTRFDGFVRGLAITDQHVYVAASMARRRSRSMGTANKPASLPSDRHSWIYRQNRQTNKREQRNLSAIGAEIYDLLTLPGDLAVDRDSTIDPVVQRFWQCEAEVTRVGDHLRLLLWQEVQKTQILAQTLQETVEQLDLLVQDRSDLVAEVDPMRHRLRETAEYVETTAESASVQD